MGGGEMRVLLIALWAILPLLSSPSPTASPHLGEAFALVFLQNGPQRPLQSNFQLLLTSSSSSSSSVSISMKNPGLRLALRAPSAQTLVVKIPPQAELIGSDTSEKVVVVRSDGPISILMLSEKPTSSDSTALFPLHLWGLEYSVVTPKVSPDLLGVFSVVAWDEPTKIDVHLEASVTFRGRSYPRGSILSILLTPFQALQLQSPSDLSGTRVVATKPVSVFAGRTCWARLGPCEHLVEQLLPVSRWGTMFLVPPLPFETLTGLVYISTSQTSHVETRHGATTTFQDLQPNHLTSYKLHTPNSLFISSDVGVQVVFFSDRSRKDSISDSFFMLIPDVSTYCSSYLVFTLEGYKNHMVLVAKTSEASELTLNKRPLENLAWNLIPGSDYSWSSKALGSEFGVYVVEHEFSTFGVWNVGIREEKSYGSTGVCNADPCRLVTCRPKESCQVEKGQPRCLSDYLGTCLGSPDLEFHTFDGFSIHVPAGCAYTLTKTCSPDPSLEPFEVQEELRGDSRGRVAKVYVYGSNISIHRGEGDTILVNHRPTTLPLLLEGGKVRISLHEGRVILQTAFGLQVTSEPDGALLVAVPSGYFASTCGLCGNFNEDPEDEMKLPGGSGVDDIHEWVQSWRDPTCQEEAGEQEEPKDPAPAVCLHHGRSFLPPSEFWEDGTCRRLCRCLPDGNKTCWEASCQPPKTCQTLRGVPGCHSGRFLTCLGTGDPHYTTFDGRRFDFQGTCIYQFAALCSPSNPDLIPFNVTVENNNRGSRAVSFTKTVTLEVYGATVTMSQENPRKVKVNGSFVELPFRHPDGLFVLYFSGVHGFVRTDFGLRVSFDWYSYARVLLPTAYAGAVCGLCGNANGDPDDDFISRHGERVGDEMEFGDSWKVDEVPGCSFSGCQGACLACSEEEKEIYRGDAFCGVINRAEGPFRACHGVVEPESFLEDCAFDACQHKGQRDTVCRAVEAYVAECQARGVKLEAWRMPSFCDPSCPLHSHYELCGSSCPATCRPGLVPEACSTTSSCVEGCFCDEGFVLSGDICVEATSCGCEAEGFYYQAHQVFFTSLCRQRCRCHPGGAVECENVTCGTHQECRVENGVLGCFSRGFGQLEVSGDPHYVTFDGRRFHLRGSCSYVLVRLCGAIRGFRNFSVVLEHEVEAESRLTGVKKVLVALGGHVVALEGGRKWEVTVNSERLPLPFSTPDQHLWVGQEGENIILHDISGLRVLFNPAPYLLVTVPDLYRGHLCGLGGNFNGDPEDDFQLQNGSLVATAEDFVASWKVSTGNEACGYVNDRGCEDPSTFSSWCNLLADPKGPFASCHQVLEPQEHVQRCLHDLCEAQGQHQVLCRSLQAYSAACQAAGGTFQAWRNETFCPLSCPPHSHYELCTRSCGLTCSGLVSSPTPCTWSCFEGCQCDDGFLFDGGTCVSLETCGCVHHGRYLKAFETFISTDCSNSCRCDPARGLSCHPLRCSPDEVCSIQDGTRRCLQLGHCLVAPGGSLTTFDGLRGDLVAPGTFKVVALCDERSLSWFKVVVELDECRQEKVLAPVNIFIFFREAFISINQHLEVWINGLFTRPPAVVSNSVSITPNLTVTHKSGLAVTFSPEGLVTITVRASLADRLCAPCGNFNGDADDDLELPDGRVVRSISEVLDAWKAKDFMGCD